MKEKGASHKFCKVLKSFHFFYKKTLQQDLPLNNVQGATWHILVLIWQSEYTNQLLLAYAISFLDNVSQIAAVFQSPAKMTPKIILH